MSAKGHAAYLAIIAVLAVVLVYLGAKAVRAARVLKEVEERFGVHEKARSSIPRKEPLRRLTAKDILRSRKLADYQKEINLLIQRAVALGEFGKDSRLKEACVLALQGGKRLRPIILIEIARTVSKNRDDGQDSLVDPAEAALFIEYLHSASLVVDDLPAFDNDAERRGKPTLHAATTPAVAQMAALSLVAAGMQNLCRQIDWIRAHCPEFKNVDRIGTRLCSHVGQMLGVFGAAGGQYMDTSSAEELLGELGGPPVNPEVVMKILYQKTATFFEISAVTGWLIAGGDPSQVGDVQLAGKHLGVAFQVADDIGDMTRDARRQEGGKPGWNVANIIGKEAATREMERNLAACRHTLQSCGLWTPVWAEIFQKVKEMAVERSPAPEAQPLNFQRGAARADNVGEPRAEAAFGSKALEDEGSPNAPMVPASSQPPNH